MSFLVKDYIKCTLAPYWSLHQMKDMKNKNRILRSFDPILRKNVEQHIGDHLDLIAGRVEAKIYCYLVFTSEGVPFFKIGLINSRQCLTDGAYYIRRYVGDLTARIVPVFMADGRLRDEQKILKQMEMHRYLLETKSKSSKCSTKRETFKYSPEIYAKIHKKFSKCTNFVKNPFIVVHEDYHLKVIRPPLDENYVYQEWMLEYKKGKMIDTNGLWTVDGEQRYCFDQLYTKYVLENMKVYQKIIVPTEESEINSDTDEKCSEQIVRKK
jgi:hypothetical protein